jgi:hypothetical protein
LGRREIEACLYEFLEVNADFLGFSILILLSPNVANAPAVETESITNRKADDLRAMRNMEESVFNCEANLTLKNS